MSSKSVPTVHSLQLASSHVSGVPQTITLGSHNSAKPALTKQQVAIDEEKMRKALEVKQKLEQGMKKFQAMKEKGMVVKRNRFDVTPAYGVG